MQPQNAKIMASLTSVSSSSEGQEEEQLVVRNEALASSLI